MKNFSLVLFLFALFLCSGCSSNRTDNASKSLPPINYNSPREYLISIVERYSAIPNISYIYNDEEENIHIAKKDNKLREVNTQGILSGTYLDDGENTYFYTQPDPFKIVAISDAFYSRKLLLGMIDPRNIEKMGVFEYSIGLKTDQGGYDCQMIYIRQLDSYDSYKKINDEYCINEEYSLPVYRNGVIIVSDIKTDALPDKLFKLPPGYKVK